VGLGNQFDPAYLLSCDLLLLVPLLPSLDRCHPGHLGSASALKSFSDNTIRTSRVFIDILWSLNPSVVGKD